MSTAIDDGRRRAKRRHRDIESTWIANGRLACDLSKDSCSGLDRERLLLLGMAFTLEYAFEAAALCNPSMVALGPLTPDGDQPIVMSARAIGRAISPRSPSAVLCLPKAMCGLIAPAHGPTTANVASGRSIGRHSA